MENVGALTIRGLDAVLGSLAEIGYDAEWQDIRAEDMGAPHRRERIWIMAYPQSISCEGSFSNKQKKQKISTNGFDRNTEPKHSMDRMDDGIPHRVDRLKGLGNAIVPQIAELLFRQIKDLI